MRRGRSASQISSSIEAAKLDSHHPSFLHSSKHPFASSFRVSSPKMALNRLAVSLASRRIRTRSLAAAATRSLSTSTSSSFSSPAAVPAGGEDGAAAAAAAAAAAEAFSSSSSSALFLLPDASAPVAAAASLLDSIGPNSGLLISLPWWAAIPAAAVAVRAALLPLSVAQARSAAAFGPLMQRARQEEREEEERLREAAAIAAKAADEGGDSTGKGQQPQKARRPPPTTATLRRLLALREQTQTPHPRWLLLSPLLQLPVFASAVLGVRAMANASWPGFSDGGALWFPDLTARAVEIVSASSSSSSVVFSSSASSSVSPLASMTAPMGVAGGLLPALVAAGTLAAAASAFRKVGAGGPTENGSSFSSSSSPQGAAAALRLLLEWLALPAFIGSLLLPQGAVLYWASSSGAALAQGVALRSASVRELLGLREIAERAAAAGSGRRRTSSSSKAGEEAAAAATALQLSNPSSSSSSTSTPPVALAHLSRAAELRAAGDVDGAIKAASAAVAASQGQSARAWFALGQLRATAAHWHDAELAFCECARLEEKEEEAESREGIEKGGDGFRSRRKHEVARALFGAGVAQRMQGDSEAASCTLRRAVTAAEVACGGTEAVEAEVDTRRKRKKKSPAAKARLPPLTPPLATLARSLLALASSLDAQNGGEKKTVEALAAARRAAGLDEGAERMAVAPLLEKLKREREAKRGGAGSGL